jgi:hypothetical protein
MSVRAAALLVAASSVASLVSGCGGGPRLVSRDLTLVASREGEGRPAVTALAFRGGGRQLLVGDYRGAVESLDVSQLEPAGAGRVASRVGEVLALAPEPLVVVQRNSRRAAHERLSGACVLDDGGVAAWSHVARKLWYSAPPREPDSPEDTAPDFDVELTDLDVVAASGAGPWLVDLADREQTRLELRHPPSLDAEWSRELGHSADAVGADDEAHVVVVADDQGLELHVLRDGTVFGRIEGAGGVPHSLHDGRRFLLVQQESLAVLDLGATLPLDPSVVPGFVAHRGGVTAVAVSADGSLVATGGARGDLRVFRVTPLAALPPLRGSDP